MTKNPVKIVLLLGALALAGIFALYVSNSTTPIGEKQKALKDLGGEFQLNSLMAPLILTNLKDKQSFFTLDSLTVQKSALLQWA
ncbi:hypothetical protein [Photobacterium angustum]|uniref:hypothetical protein n=1 Tax=Photobacterium angustum TaxID=661 RepID=UPI000B1E7052|nr:hypothetical protein [Photobacterium angustum]